METGVVDGELAEVHHALAGYVTGLDHLIKVVDDHGLGQLGGVTELVEVMKTFEQARNRLSLVDHALVAEADRLDAATALCQRNLKRVWSSALFISTGEAGRRVDAAAAVGARTSMLGEPVDPVRPHVAAAQRLGLISPDKVDLIHQGLALVDRRGFDPAQIDVGEQILTEAAAQLPPEDIRKLVKTVVDRIDPDGTVPNDQLNHDRRFFHLRQTGDGAWRGEFRLTGTAGEKLKTLLDPLTKIRVDESGEPDTRTTGQRTHDALEEVCDRQLRAGDTPDSGGTPATVIVLIDYNDLLNRCGYGTTTDGMIIPIEALLEMADNAEVIPAVLNSAGAVLHLGRSHRFATRAQTLALIGRDVGCSFPGCRHPANYCERHHIIDWANGGLTNLDNLTLLCRYHHHNFLARGWKVSLNADGIPEWRPPRWVDHDQKPMINTRILVRLLARRDGQTRAP